MNIKIKKILLTTLMSSVLTTAVAADFPNRDVRMVIPWGAGGGTDGIVRKLSIIAEKELGGTIYAENIEGGISAIGVMDLMSAKADGYTIGSLTYDSIVTIPWQDKLKRYDLDKLSYIARLTSEPDALIVDSTSKYKTFEDVMSDAKAHPGKIKIGIQNIGSRLHLAVLQLEKKADVDFKIIAYPGGAAAQKEAILANEVDIVATSLGDFSGLIDDGKAHGIVEFSTQRNLTYTDVPTAYEKGIDLVMGSFIVIAVPQATPKDVQNKLEAAYKVALESNEFQNWVKKIGVTPDWLGSDKTPTWIKDTKDNLHLIMQNLVDQGILRK
ncbi:ABC transporter substrate-binding protein [Marinomonas ushuaiensis DSM 15871]|uniref:ABC transporter substrate-binding protein n=1 Tax=Marinomonas ushuaiensis DSM 15871 TaxID=1122207 RepID=X7EB70_9GAMM|nr:tripartite tricarboxylate transporter substrate binding protein [Marinomonas ushuaiensis]ETX12431.1 ABC transporter substrate-binding protein [Marinomonas ushuaiensis DSM 15871]